MVADVSFCEQLLDAASSRPTEVLALDADTGEAWTYEKIAAEGRRWARLLHDARVGAGDRIATVLDTRSRALGLTLGIALVGAVEAPLNPQYGRPQFAYAVDDLAATLLIVEQRFRPLVSELLPAERTWTLDEHIARMHAATPLPDDVLWVPRAHDLAWILYTSGTTGPSKGVMTSWQQVAANARAMTDTDLFGPTDIWYNPYPLCHVSGRFPFVAFCTLRGRVVNRAGFSTSSFWADIDRYHVTGTLLMGATIAYLSSQPESADDADHPLEKVYLAPVPPDFDAIARRFGFVGLSVFNMTEISSPIATPQPFTEQTASCGTVRPGYECRVVDEHDRPLPPGPVGELVVRGEEPWTLMLGYWNKPQATVEATRNLWFHTGDAFSYDADGRFYFVDRLKDCIRRRGENISSMEVEGIVVGHPDIEEAAAVAVPSKYGEDEVKLVVAPRDRIGLTGDELADYLRDRLPRYAQPGYIEFVDAIPKTASAKFKKAELRAAHDPSTCWVAPALAR